MLGRALHPEKDATTDDADEHDADYIKIPEAADKITHDDFLS
jgi:hypothetical protein